MRDRILFIAFVTLLALSGCRQNSPEDKSASFDWNNNDKIEYAVDYTVLFSADHDSTMLYHPRRFRSRWQMFNLKPRRSVVYWG